MVFKLYMLNPLKYNVFKDYKNKYKIFISDDNFFKYPIILKNK